MIVGRNLEVDRGEIDLVVRFDDVHVAVEVKTIGPRAMSDKPIDRISAAKLRQVRGLAGRLGARYGRMRVDFVGVRVGVDGVDFNWRTNVA